MFDKLSPVFQANHEATEDIVINQGGTDSGKTIAITQEVCVLLCDTEPPPEDAIATILSGSVPDSKKGAYRVFKSLYANNKTLQYHVIDWNDTDRVVTFRRGWILEFIGATTEQNAKQGKRQYLFVNEANGVDWAIFWQMAKRTRIRTWIDYNPSAPFWAHEKLIGTLPESNELSATVKLIISDHRHNPFLDEKDHYKTENIKDPGHWKVYARGVTGNLQGLVYTNWKQIPDTAFPWQEDGKFGGVDFGYTNDPTACVVMVRVANKIFVHELCYEAGLSPQRISTLFKAAGFTSANPIYCEHDGDMIKQIRLQGKLLTIAARKGAGSISAGIMKVREYEVYYTASSKNIDYERKKYMFVKDPSTNKLTNAPTEIDNHLMDAIRYGIYTHFFRAS